MSGGHSHGHSHGPGSSSPTDHRRRLAIVLVLTSTVLVAEVIGAVISGSLALLADAGHMLTDTAGLVIALIAATLAVRPATAKRTWGYRRAEVLGATLQAAALLAVGTYVLIEGIRRLFEPPEIETTAVLVFGLVGLVANVIGIVILTRGGRSDNVNMRAAFLEVLNDTLGSVAVLAAAGVIALTGWQRADAVASLVIAVLIVPRTVILLRETVSVLLETTPPGLDLDDVRRHLLAVPHVLEVHDLHASQITSGLPVLSAHVVVEDSCFRDGHAPQILDQLQDCLTGHFPVSVDHSTFQLESPAHAAHELAAHQ
ncbi:cation transporter [Blastococcus sp. MG754426]|uniref:cation diffusion facilitator family transporter n=1 Tax=unclassified Blastococcus TaxID=2619396 RepID=UPI0021027489|nr:MULTISPECIES: cation diffusion facilitator family transporter [unclassified Blastococcus]MCF6507768.1 cation transporter [Blastococcus sp. MG754426]MCF6510225.1 cation transporter [Blastococcus sp. MG754427]MCF6735891.1 cation transporter [Blastococcus sp. KM273129]